MTVSTDLHPKGSFPLIGIDGTPITRTPQTHPYNYEEFVVWRQFPQKHAKQSLYTDRMMRWDYEKYKRISDDVFGPHAGQYWNTYDPDLVQEFLRQFFEAEQLEVTCLVEHCDQSSGFPVWQIYYDSKE